MNRKLVTTFCALALASAASAVPHPKQVEVDITKVYVPVGYDDNDNVQVLTQGFFNNTCYKIGPYSTHIDESAKTIRFRQTAYDYGFECLQIMVPFTQVVDLGMLRDGSWQLFDASGAHALGGLSVSRATTKAADDYLYANVTDASLRKDDGKAPALIVEGEFTDRCSIMKEIRVHYYPEVIVVQPIMEQLKDRAGNCGPARSRFEYRVELKKDLKGTYLLHVRSLSGKAVSKLAWLP